MQTERHRVFIASQPKAGTYLVSEIVRCLGYHLTYLHFGCKFLDPYDPVNMQSSLQNYRENRIRIPIKQSIRLIRPGEIGVGHIPHSNKAENLFSDFKVIYVSRELRSALFSELKFGVSNKRIKKPSEGDFSNPRKAMLMFLNQYGRQSISRAQEMSSWSTVEKVLHLKFEDIKSQTENSIKLISAFLDANTGGIKKRLHEQVLGSKTLTKSESRLKFEDFWSDKAEALFNKFDGAQVNSSMGYPIAPSEPNPDGLHE